MAEATRRKVDITPNFGGMYSAFIGDLDIWEAEAKKMTGRERLVLSNIVQAATMAAHCIDSNERLETYQDRLLALHKALVPPDEDGDEEDTDD